MGFSSFEKQLLSQFHAAMSALPNVNSHSQIAEAPVSRLWPADAEISVNIAGKPLTLIVEARKSAYPRDVRELLWRFRQLRSEMRSTYYSSDAIFVLVAESISPGARELLKTEQIGYYEVGGSLFIPGPGIYLYIEKPSSKSSTRSIRSLFSGRRSQVVHALLLHPEQWFGVADLARLVEVSTATVSQTLMELERHEWLESQGKGPAKERRLVEPGPLLDAWAAQPLSQHSPTFQRYYVPSATQNAFARIFREFDTCGVEYAVTGEVAAQAYTPFLSNVSQLRCRVLESNFIENALHTLEALAVDEGANLLIMPTQSRSDLLFKKRTAEMWLASPVQVYLDLIRSEGRAADMAQHLRQERIGF